MIQDRRNYWLDEEDPDKLAKSFAWRAAAWTLGAVLVFSLIGLVGWGSKVAFSNWKGAGNAVIIKNEANNRIAAQEAFESLITDIKASDAKLDQAAALVKANPKDPTYQTQFTGLTNHCLDVIGQYNAAARKYTQQQFKASDLPSVIDTSDPSTDCKESKK